MLGAYEEMKQMNRELLAKITDLEMKKMHDNVDKTNIEMKISALEIEHDEKIKIKAAEQWHRQLTDSREKESIVEAYVWLPWKVEMVINNLGKMHMFNTIIKAHFTCEM